MPFPPTLTAEEANSAFVGTFEAYLASGDSPALGDDFPALEAHWIGAIAESNLASAGTLFAGTDFRITASEFLGGFLGFVGGVDGSDTALPSPPVPDFGPIRPNQGAAGLPFPPALGTDEANSQFVGTFEGYLVPLPEAVQTPLASSGQIVVDLAAGPMGDNQLDDPAGSQAQLDGQFDVFVGQIQPPFTTSRLPRLAFGPFRNLTGLTYQIELDAFAKFGLAQIRYRIYANDQGTPPYNVIDLAGQASYTTSLILTLDSPAATLHAGAVLTDSFGNVATQSVNLLGVPDTVPPTAPPFLYVVELPDGTWLFVWGPATDDFVVDHYQIDQVDSNGDLITNLAANLKANYYLWAGAAAGNSYRVLAFDLAGNVSPSSPIARAIAAATQATPVEITEVMAEQVPGTASIQVSWVVTPQGTPCTAQIVDGLDRPISLPVTSAAGVATLAVSDAVSAGLYRVKVTAA
ncbi:MAG: hypothetical protein KGR26_02930 [Cyanobacteria bacterium REEB65]|nr:hypothetical protein [Cyanobacteria bacterium REEB65]